MQKPLDLLPRRPERTRAGRRTLANPLRALRPAGLRARLDGGGLLHLTSLLAVHLAVTAIVAVTSGAAGLAVLVVPLIAAAFALARGGIDHARVALATCWALALVQVGLAALSAA